jgi:hypothetical protein
MSEILYFESAANLGHVTDDQAELALNFDKFASCSECGRLFGATGLLPTRHAPEHERPNPDIVTIDPLAQPLIHCSGSGKPMRIGIIRRLHGEGVMRRG